MTEITIQMSDKLAAQIGGANAWLQTIIELSVVGFKMPATARCSAEISKFLSTNPTPHEVLGFYISDEMQRRLDLLLELNREAETTVDEQQELDEWMKIEHIAIMLKAAAGKLLKNKA